MCFYYSIFEFYIYSKTILFLTLPSPVMLTSTISPSLRYLGSFIPMATPDGVPVRTTVPASRVVPWLMKLTISSTPKRRSPVPEFCLSSPLTVVLKLRVEAFPTTAGETRRGPRGANLSKPLLKHHWGTPPAFLGSRCHARAETSLETTYPAMWERADSLGMFLPVLPMTMPYIPMLVAVYKRFK